jgi:ABC-type nitrate/sulfonate/bicarbonate transport system substrate-binding protein
MNGFKLKLATLVGAALMFGMTAACAEPLKIRIGWVVTPAQMTPILFQKKDILKHYGKTYTVDAVRFRGSSPQITALAAGELDIAALAFSSFALAIQNANMKDIRAIADVFQDGAHGHYSSEYFVNGDSGIKNVKDLKGKRVASNGVGGAIDMALRKMLKSKGLEKNDYTLVEVRFPNMPAMLKEKKVDLVGTVLPFSNTLDKQGARALFTMKDAMGETQMILWAARKPFLDKNKQALLDFFEDQQRALHWFLDPKNREEAVKIIADFTKRPAASYKSWLFTKKDYYRAPDSQLNVKALSNNIALQLDLGFLKAPIDVPKFVDVSLAKEAAARLK